jgi:hypothetical protein
VLCCCNLLVSCPNDSTVKHVLKLPGSTSIIMSCSNSIIELMERSLAIAAERSLRCSKSEPWCFISISAAISLLKVHLGILDRSTAKYSCAQAFLNLHKQHPRSQIPQQPISQSASYDVGRVSCKSTNNSGRHAHSRLTKLCTRTYILVSILRFSSSMRSRPI